MLHAVLVFLRKRDVEVTDTGISFNFVSSDFAASVSPNAGDYIRKQLVLTM